MEDSGGNTLLRDLAPYFHISLLSKRRKTGLSFQIELIVDDLVWVLAVSETTANLNPRPHRPRLQRLAQPRLRNEPR